MKQPNGLYRHAITEPTDRHYIVGHGATETFAREDARNAAFRACPILSEYLATALQDMEHDQTCTIYDCPDETFKRAWDDCTAFMSANRNHIDQARGTAGFGECINYKSFIDYDTIGYYFYMVRVGHGVGFTDDDNAACLQAMDDYATLHRCDGLYFGDDAKVYWS